MRSTNPVFSRSEPFAAQRTTQQAPDAYGQPTNPYAGYGQQPYGRPGLNQPSYAPQQTAGGLMTIDDVITKTAITLGVLVVTAALTLMFLPPGLLLPKRWLSWATCLSWVPKATPSTGPWAGCWPPRALAPCCWWDPICSTRPYAPSFTTSPPKPKPPNGWKPIR